jgi:carbohydrate-selective porin OprB
MATGAPVEHRGSGGVYAIADRIVWSAGHGSPASVSAFAQIGVGDSRVNQIGARTYSETTLELTYLVQVNSWLAVQPDVQYVNHPGNAPTVRYAVVPGLRVALSH